MENETFKRIALVLLQILIVGFFIVGTQTESIIITCALYMVGFVVWDEVYNRLRDNWNIK